jgi:hypothetical protein
MTTINAPHDDDGPDRPYLDRHPTKGMAMSTTQPRNRTATGLAPLLSGVAFAILTVVAFVVLGHATSSPKIGSPPSTIASFYLAHRSDEELAAYLLAVNAALLAVFVTACRSRVGADRPARSDLFFAGGMIASATFLFAGAVHLALAEAAGHHLNPTALQALNALDINTGLAFTGAIAIMLIGAAATLSRRSDAVRILGWGAIPLAIINLTPAGVGAFPLTAIWIIATGILISRRPDPSARPVAAAALAA